MEKFNFDYYNDSIKKINCYYTYNGDVYSVLEKLCNKGYKLGVISNGNLEQQTDKLSRTGILKFFDIVTTGSEYDYAIWLNRKNKENEHNVKEINSLSELLNVEL